MSGDSKETRRARTIALLYGGHSSERGISILSSRSVREAIQDDYVVVPIDTGAVGWVEHLVAAHADLAFICLHGKGGEDGSVQGLCECLGIPYTGSGVSASALAMNKSLAKLVVSRAGIRVPASVSSSDADFVEQAQALLAKAGKVVVKPALGGSSLGLYFVEGESGLREAIEKTRQLGEGTIVEQFVSGRELTAAVYGGKSPTALPVIEIVSKTGVYDFKAKYAIGVADHLCPAPLSEELTAQCQAMSCVAHAALGCAGFTRSDFILDAEQCLWYLETNTIPGMTATSLLPDAANKVGMDYKALCKRIIDDGFARAENR